MNPVFFLYNNKRYSFNFDIFKNYSGYFSRIFEENDDMKANYTINLLSEFEYCKELSDECINSFINYCQNQVIDLTNTNIIGIHFLSIKYEVQSLIDKTNKYINIHYIEIIDQYLSTNINESESDEMIHIYEILISKHMSFYLNDNRLLNFSINKLYRILCEYSKQEITDQKLKEKTECQLVEFLIKYVQKNGSESSFLFSIIKIGNKGCLLLNEKLSQFSNFIDIEHVKWSIFQNINYMNIKHKKQMKKERKKMRSNLINTINELFQMEQFNQDNNDDKNKSIALMKYGFLYSIGSIFNDDIKERDSKKLSKFDLLDLLLKENLLSTKSSILIENRKYIDIISLVSKILVNQQKEEIVNLFKFISKDNSVIDFVDKVFPYLILKYLKPFKLLLIWIPCIKHMIQSKIKFSLEIEKNKFEFNQSSSELKIKINLKFNEKNDLSLSQGSEILYDKCKKSFNLLNINCTVIVTFPQKIFPWGGFFPQPIGLLSIT